MNVQFQDNTTKNYSWLKRGKSCSVENINFSNSINTASAITSDGYSLWYLKSRTTTSREIIRFIESLFKLIKITRGIEKDEIGIILDNCQTHRSKLVQNYAMKSLAILYFIPAYAPELAPIETYFSRIKSAVIRESKSCEINLKTKKWMDLVSKVLQNIRKDYIKSLWKSYIQLIKEELKSIVVSDDGDHI